MYYTLNLTRGVTQPPNHQSAAQGAAQSAAKSNHIPPSIYSKTYIDPFVPMSPATRSARPGTPANHSCRRGEYAGCSGLPHENAQIFAASNGKAAANAISVSPLTMTHNMKSHALPIIVNANIYRAALCISKTTNPLQIFIVPQLLELDRSQRHPSRERMDT